MTLGRCESAAEIVVDEGAVVSVLCGVAQNRRVRRISAMMLTGERGTAL